MSATLSWASSGLGTKTGTAIGNLFADLVTLISSKAADASFSWEVASSNTASTPYQITLKRKDASAGRLLLVAWSSAPAGNNAAILDGAPTTNSLYGAYFPAGNVDTPSNLTAASGTIMGDDTGAVKVWAGMGIATIYSANVQPFYFDSTEALVFGFQNPANATTYLSAAGAILVDAADNAYDAVMSTSGAGAGFGVGPNTLLQWSSATVNAGTATQCVRTNYGSSNRTYFQAWVPSGAWANSAVGPTDIMTDTGANEAYFAPLQLLGQTKGEGFILKLRQMALGPGTVGAFTVYNTTGPTVAARQISAATAGANGQLWLTEFKL